MSIWASVRRLILEGKDPVVYVHYGMLVIPGKKKPGPKPKTKEERRLTAGAVLLLGGKAKPRCLNPQCRSTIGRKSDHKRQVCGEACRRAAVEAFGGIVALLEDSE